MTATTAVAILSSVVEVLDFMEHFFGGREEYVCRDNNREMYAFTISWL